MRRSSQLRPMEPMSAASAVSVKGVICNPRLLGDLIHRSGSGPTTIAPQLQRESSLLTMTCTAKSPNTC